MMLGILRSASETSVLGAAARASMVLACILALAACESLSNVKSDFNEHFGETLSSFKKLGAGDPGRSHAADTTVDNDREVIVTLDRPAATTLQAQLAKLGFRPGPVDGIVGRQTARAIKRYQAAHGLPVTGRISLQFLEHLELTVAGRREKPRQPTPPVNKPPVKVASNDLPEYLPGTSFTYSNGDTERVVDIKDGMIRWARGDGSTFSAHRNFLLPKLYWTSDGDRGTATISVDVDKLWPIREGAKITFAAQVTTQIGNNPDSTVKRKDLWRCRHEGNKNITVEAGTFDTAVLACRRGSEAASPEMVRTWYYAQSVRHYVRFVENNLEDGVSRRIDLVAVRPGARGWPPIMRAALARAVVHALEKEGDDSRMPWTSSGVQARVTIEAKSRFAGEDGRPCRRFVQIWSKGDRLWHFPAAACKSESGQWTIPGQPSQTANSLATADNLS